MKIYATLLTMLLVGLINSSTQAACNKEDGTIVPEFPPLPSGSIYSGKTLSSIVSTHVWTPNSLNVPDDFLPGWIIVQYEPGFEKKEGCVEDEIVWRIEPGLEVKITEAYYISGIPYNDNNTQTIIPRTTDNIDVTKAHEQIHIQLASRYSEFENCTILRDLYGYWGDNVTYETESEADDALTTINDKIAQDYIIEWDHNYNHRSDWEDTELPVVIGYDDVNNIVEEEIYIFDDNGGVTLK